MNFKYLYFVFCVGELYLLTQKLTGPNEENGSVYAIVNE